MTVIKKIKSIKIAGYEYSLLKELILILIWRKKLQFSVGKTRSEMFAKRCNIISYRKTKNEKFEKIDKIWEYFITKWQNLIIFSHYQ